MAVVVAGESSYNVSSDGPSKFSKSKQEDGGRWYFSRKEIEDSSVSRKDGIDLKKETYLRKSYCTFLQDLGIRLKVPQVTIATSIVFCHRFFLRHSHAKNDRRTIATVCMFLAGKVEETPRPLKDVILVSFEIIHKKDPAAAQRIKQKEVYEQQKELILIGERVVLGTLAFDLNVQHPYKPLVEAIKKFKVAQNALAQVAWNFVNDGLRTSLCLQFKPHHIAAGAIFLAAKFLKVKLPSDGEKVWWQEFDVTPRQLEEISNQMLELYEQNGVPPSQGSEIEGNAAGGRFLAKISLNVEHGLKQLSTRSAADNSLVENHDVPQSDAGNQTNDNGSAEMGSVITDHRAETDSKDRQSEQLPPKDNNRISNKIMRTVSGDQEKIGGRKETIIGERMDDSLSRKSHSSSREGPPGQPPKEVLKKIDKDKVKAALEKRKKSRGEISYKKDVLDENDLIEKELEDGVELAAEDEKNKREKKQSWSKAEDQSHEEFRDGKSSVMKDTMVKEMEEENAEEGEMIDDASSILNSRKRKSGSPPERQPDVKKRHHYDPSEDTHNHKTDMTGYADRELKA